jgi:hypothetical protein
VFLGRIARHTLMHPIYKLRHLGRIAGLPWDTTQVEGARRREISCRALEVVAVIPKFLLTVDLQAAHEQLQNKLFLSNSVERLSNHYNDPLNGGCNRRPSDRQTWIGGELDNGGDGSSRMEVVDLDEAAAVTCRERSRRWRRDRPVRTTATHDGNNGAGPWQVRATSGQQAVEGARTTPRLAGPAPEDGQKAAAWVVF